MCFDAYDCVVVGGGSADGVDIETYRSPCGVVVAQGDIKKGQERQD